MATELHDKIKTVAIVLAGGSSSRMGQPKQLITIDGESLLRRTIETVIRSGVDRTLVVLGANQNAHAREIADLPVQSVHNATWERGMGSSLKDGVQFAMEAHPHCERIMIAVCDQPLLNSQHLEQLLRVSEENPAHIAASFYSGHPGVPVVFPRVFFSELRSIKDDGGASQIINHHLSVTRMVDFPEGSTDLDTPEDLEKFRRRQ